MRKIFWEDPYQCSLETKVVSVEGSIVTFDATIAYSFAGGQESDQAWVNEIPILNSRIDKSLIYYTLREDHGLAINDKVTMTIDWPRRNRLMRLHFAAELVLEIVTKKWCLGKLGAHIAENKARIDFKSENSVKSLLPEILAEYNQIIEHNLPIEKGYADLANERRYWKIEGFAQVPCGGTHVKATGEVGFVQLKRDHPGKSVERIEIRLLDVNPSASFSTPIAG